MCEDQRVCPSKMEDGFAKRPQGECSAVSERVSAVKKDDIQVAIKLEMLKTVIQYQCVQAGAFA